MSSCGGSVVKPYEHLWWREADEAVRAATRLGKARHVSELMVRVHRRRDTRSEKRSDFSGGLVEQDAIRQWCGWRLLACSAGLNARAAGESWLSAAADGRS